MRANEPQMTTHHITCTPCIFEKCCLQHNLCEIFNGARIGLGWRDNICQLKCQGIKTNPSSNCSEDKEMNSHDPMKQETQFSHAKGFCREDCEGEEKIQENLCKGPQVVLLLKQEKKARLFLTNLNANNTTEFREHGHTCFMPPACSCAWVQNQ